MERFEARSYFEAAKQIERVARVFGAHDRHAAQRVEQSRRSVFEISKGRRAHPQRSGHEGSLSYLGLGAWMDCECVNHPGLRPPLLGKEGKCRDKVASQAQSRSLQSPPFQGGVAEGRGGSDSRSPKPKTAPSKMEDAVDVSKPGANWAARGHGEAARLATATAKRAGRFAAFFRPMGLDFAPMFFSCLNS